ncbi:MAG: TIR domain-containing protein [Anaerolineae bacterium]|nr:TIR domain-containing protein [Anaerolineae bacterium]
MAHIFISYSKQDSEFVRYLRALLEAESFDVWFDDELNPGDGWWDRLEVQVKESDAFLVIMSTNSRGSKWVQRELLLAENRKIPVFPVLLSGEVWAHLADLQYVDMRKGLLAKLPIKLLHSLRAINTESPKTKSVEITIQFGSILQFPADVAVFKYANGFHGADARAAEELIRAGTPDSKMRPKEGEYALLPTGEALSASQVLFIGTRKLRQIGYGGIRELGANALSLLAIHAPETRRIVMTIHGPNFGLDESEALLSQFAGYLDALEAGNYPPALERITIVEFNENRAERLQEVLDKYLHDEPYAERLHDQDWLYRLNIPEHASGEKPQVAPQPEPTKTHAYVIMPVNDALDDIFYYGIQNPVHAQGLLCERVDTQEITDELMKQIMQRIDSAAVVIAEVSQIDPAVSWQVGYAWGKKRPVILLTTTRDATPFPGQPYLVYSKIRDLDKALTEQLNSLKDANKF